MEEIGKYDEDITSRMTGWKCDDFQAWRRQKGLPSAKVRHDKKYANIEYVTAKRIDFMMYEKGGQLVVGYRVCHP